MTWEGGRPRNKCPDLAGSIPDVCVWEMEVEGEHGGCVSPGICEGGEGGSDTFCTRLLQLDIFFPRLDLGILVTCPRSLS